jgi:hypothetical protein
VGEGERTDCRVTGESVKTQGALRVRLAEAPANCLIETSEIYDRALGALRGKKRGAEIIIFEDVDQRR